jgi:two-component system response regulator MprA
LRALLRRTSFAGAGALRVADLVLDPSTREVTRGGTPLDLTKTEFALLELLMTNAGRVMSRSQIYEQVWDYDFGPTSNSLEVYIGYLRRKIGEPRLIHTVRGVGYTIREPR